MSPEIVLQIAGLVGTAIIALLAWSLRRNLTDLDNQVKAVATDVRQLANQGARHGEALAGGVVKFQAIEKRLDKLEDKQETLGRECFACRTERQP